jgi:Amt family ammonium transporter
MRNDEEGINGNAITTARHGHETGAAASSSLELEDDAPHNVNNVILGTALLWIGWFGFNGGSALGGNLRAVSAITSTHITACSGGSANILIFWFINNLAQKFTGGANARKLSIMMFCDGAIIALVAITPAAGYVRLCRSLATRKLLTEPGPSLERSDLRLGTLHLCLFAEKASKRCLKG